MGLTSKARAVIGVPAFFLAMAVTIVPARSAEPVGQPCGLGIVHSGHIIPASSHRSAVPVAHIRITFLGHSTFFIETPGGANAATDYNGFNVPATPPQIVTMNNSHTSHYTDALDPRIRHALPGWGSGKILRHNLRHRDLRVFNVPTNINEYGDTGSNNNSVFVFEASGLCLAHLGHLHHFLNKEQISSLGRIDVLFVPIDGSMTLSHEEAFHIIGQIQPRLIIPMHFGFGGAEGFQALGGEKFKIKIHDGPSVVLSRRDLPQKTEVLFLSSTF